MNGENYITTRPTVNVFEVVEIGRTCAANYGSKKHKN
jgi:hypothetical protein